MDKVIRLNTVAVGMICLDCGEEFEQILVKEYGSWFAMNNENCPRCKSANIIDEKKAEKKIDLFDGSIPVIRFDDFLKNETPNKY